jgi:hypothetical protein
LSDSVFNFTVLPPKSDCRRDVLILCPLASGAKKYHYRLTLPAEVDPIPGTKVDAQFFDPMANGLRIPEVPGSDSVQSGLNDGYGSPVLLGIEPFQERSLARSGAVQANLYRFERPKSSVAQKLQPK